MKNNKIRILASFITLCILSFTLAFSSSVAIAGEIAFSVVLSGEEYVVLGEKYRVNIVVSEFTEKEFLGFTCELDYDSNVFEVDSEYLEIVSQNETYPIVNGEEGWVCWTCDTITDNNGVFTMNVLNDSSDITALKGSYIKCFVDFRVKADAPQGKYSIKVDTDSSLVGVFSESLIQSFYGKGSELSVEVLNETPEILRKLVLKEDSNLVIKKADISNTTVLTGFKNNTTVSQILENFENKAEHLSVIKNNSTLSQNSKVPSGAYVNLTVDGNLVDTIVIVLLGDVDGSAEVDATDYLNVKSYFLQKNDSLSKWALAAADVEANGVIDSTDYIKLKSYFYGLIDIYA